MKNKFLSAFLALALCLTLLPTAALADEGSAAPTTPTRDCTTDGHIDTDKDNKCDSCSIGVWFNWKDNDDHTTGTNGKGTWSFDEGTLTISGTGQMEHYTNSEYTPWADYLTSVKKIVIEGEITNVGSSAFGGCLNVTEVILPDTITIIETYAFGGCHALTTISIPEKVEKIEVGAFGDCVKLNAFEVDEENTHFYIENGVLFQWNPDESGQPNNTTSTLIAYPMGKRDTSYTIPENVTEIMSGAFDSAERLTEIALPTSLTTIDDGEFSHCERLTTITVAENNTVYTAIDGVLFSKDGKTLICYPRAKAGSSYTIPESVTTIGSLAFVSCPALREVNIPAGVTSINEDAFYSCVSLTAITVDEGSKTYKSIDGVLFSEDGTTLFVYPAGKTDRSYTVPNGVTTIGDYAFNLSSLTSVAVSEGVEEIGDCAFTSSYKLASLSLPASVTSIGAGAFSGCPVLKDVYFAGSENSWAKMKTDIDIDEKATTIHYDFGGKLTITLDVNGGTLPDGTETEWTLSYHDVIPGESPRPTRAGYSFVGWYYSAEIFNEYTETVSTTSRLWNWDDPVYADMTLTARWSRDPDTYSVTLPKIIENGAVKSSHRHAEKGELVTLTVTPDKGYVLETLTVTDKKGNTLELTDKGDGKYTFKMPAGEVTVSVTFAPEKTVTDYFADVPADSYYADAILWAVNEGITGGIGNGLFAPDETCTRAQIVTFLWRAAGCPVVDYAMSFTDVGDGYYTEAVRWAASLGIVGGYGNGLFGTSDTITREQFVTILYRFAKAMGMDVSVGEDTNILSYNDAFDVAEYAVSAFQWATGAGIVQGYDGNLMPQNSCTRAQIVTMLYRLLGTN